MEWIKTEDRIPKIYQDILIWDGETIHRGYLDPRKGYMTFTSHLKQADKKTICWLSIPEPPTV